MIVIKLGGSLFDLSDLGIRIEKLLAALQHSDCVIVPGGGGFADQVRQFDRVHTLSVDAAHWLAIHSLSLSAQLLTAVHPRCVVVRSLSEVQAVWDQEALPVADLGMWREPPIIERFPASWEVTSDSLAAGLAAHFSAPLLLAKSASLPDPVPSLKEAGNRGLVDPYFATAAREVPQLLWTNLRDDVIKITAWR